MNNDQYRPGDHYVICDRTGFKVRASDTKTEWTGAVVRKESWEPRHPQDFVEGRRDDQTVRNARPEPPDNFIGALTTAVNATANAGATALVVESSVRFGGGDRIGVILDDGTLFRVIVQAVPNPTALTLNSPLPGATSAGKAVTNYSAVSIADIG